MPEIETPARTVIVNYQCDSCGIGNMKPDGDIVYTMNPPTYPHKCSLCGNTRSLRAMYPYSKTIVDEA